MSFRHWLSFHYFRLMKHFVVRTLFHFSIDICGEATCHWHFRKDVAMIFLHFWLLMTPLRWGVWGFLLHFRVFRFLGNIFLLHLCGDWCGFGWCAVEIFIFLDFGEDWCAWFQKMYGVRLMPMISIISFLPLMWAIRRWWAMIILREVKLMMPVDETLTADYRCAINIFDFIDVK